MNETKKLRVLIVDDAAALRRGLVELLAPLAGVEVVGAAGDVPTAIAAVDELKPHVVILDIQMPGGSGIDVLAHIQRAHPGMMVTMFTNFTYEVLRRRCRAAGAQFFFDKSTEADALCAVLADLAGRAGAPAALRARAAGHELNSPPRQSAGIPVTP